MIFRTLPPEVVRQALTGHEDVLKKAMEENEVFFRRLSCPSCRGEIMPVVDARRPFREGAVLPNYLGKCKSCGSEFEPHTGIQVTLPDR